MRQRQKVLGLSVAAVCERVNITRETWYRLADGKTGSPNIALLHKLAVVYRVPAARLLSLASGRTERTRTAAMPHAHGLAGGAVLSVHLEHPMAAEADSLIDVEFELRNEAAHPLRGGVLQPVAEHLMLLDDAEGTSPSAPRFAAVPRLIDGPIALPALAPQEMAWLSVQLRMPSEPGLYVARWVTAWAACADTADGPTSPRPQGVSLHVQILPR